MLPALFLYVCEQRTILEISKPLQKGDSYYIYIYIFCGSRRYDLLTLFQTGRSHMVVLTSPPRDLEHDDISAAASPPRTPPMQGGEQEKGLSVREIRAADTPPHRVNVEDDVTIVAPSDHKGLNGTNGVAEAIRQQVF